MSSVSRLTHLLVLPRPLLTVCACVCLWSETRFRDTIKPRLATAHLLTTIGQRDRVHVVPGLVGEEGDPRTAALCRLLFDGRVSRSVGSSLVGIFGRTVMSLLPPMSVCGGVVIPGLPARDEAVDRSVGSEYELLSTVGRLGPSAGVAAVLGRGVDPNTQVDSSGATFLHLAAARGGPGGVSATGQLVAAGADLSSRGLYDRTPLHYAAASQDPETWDIAKLLVNVNPKALTVADDDKRLPWHYADCARNDCILDYTVRQFPYHDLDLDLIPDQIRWDIVQVNRND